MAGQGFSWLLQFYLLLLLVHPLDPSSRPKRDTGTSALLPEELEPEPTPWVDTALVSWMCLLVVLLITDIVLGCHLGRRLWRWWREEKRQSPLASAGLCCPRKLIQLLRHNRALLQLCLHYCPQQRPRAKRAAKGTIWKRRRLHVSPSTLTSSSSTALHAHSIAGEV